MTETTDNSTIMYEANRGDWARLRLYAVNRVHPWLRFYFPLVWFFCCLPAVFIGNMLWRVYERMGPVAFARIPHRLLVAYLLGALAGPCIALAVQLLMPWIARLANFRTPKFRGVGLGANGVSCVTAHGSVTMPWWAINDIRYDRGATYFFNNKLNAIVLPRRVHSSKTAARDYFDRAVSLWQEKRRNDVDPFQYHTVAFLIEQTEFREFVLKIQKAYALTNARGMMSVIVWGCLPVTYLYARLAHDFQVEVVPAPFAWVSCVALLIVGIRIDPLTVFLRRMNRIDGAVDPMAVTIDRQGVRWVKADGPVWIPWSDVKEVAPSRSLIVLVAAGREPIIIPRRAFCTPATAEGFLETARAYHAGLAIADAGSAWPPSPTSPA